MPVGRLSPRHRTRVGDEDNAAGIRPGSVIWLDGQEWEVMAASTGWIDLKNSEGRTRSIRPARLVDCQVRPC